MKGSTFYDIFFENPALKVWTGVYFKSLYKITIVFLYTLIFFTSIRTCGRTICENKNTGFNLYGG